ncbi:MAG: Tic22 family protein, partial [Microcystaceae cyanobacterium]
ALSTANKPDALVFAYVPVPTEVEAAKKLAGQQYQGGVPLYIARGGKEQGYLTIQQNNEQVIPFFFEQKQIDEMVARFKKEKPDLASTVKIEVVPLENVLATLQQSNDAALKQIRFVPSDESQAFIRNMINQAKNQPAAPKK